MKKFILIDVENGNDLPICVVERESKESLLLELEVSFKEARESLLFLQRVRASYGFEHEKYKTARKRYDEHTEKFCKKFKRFISPVFLKIEEFETYVKNMKVHEEEIMIDLKTASAVEIANYELSFHDKTKTAVKVRKIGGLESEVTLSDGTVFTASGLIAFHLNNALDRE